MTGGFNRQDAQDIDGDGWANIPGYDRWTLRPRLFWDGTSGAKIYATVGALAEQRRGDTLPGRLVPDGSPFRQDQRSRRLDAGLNAQAPIEGIGTLYLRASGVTQAHRHVFGQVVENDRHRTVLTEASLGGGSGGATWLAGAAYQVDSYRSRTLPAFDYTYRVPALFVQAEQKLLPDLTLAGSARLDDHSEYGTRVSPRLSMLFKPGPWTVRASLGRGFYAPTPFIEEVEAAGLSRIEPLRGLRAETADTASIDFGYARGPIEASLTLFGSDIDHAVQLRDLSAIRAELVNADGVTRTRGAELLLKYRMNAVTFTGSYVRTDAREPNPDGAGRRLVQLTPRNTAGLTAVWEKHDHGRLGLEAYYTGRQGLEDNPYRMRSRAYVELGAMGELVLGKVSLFINAENLLNIRQTSFDPLLLPRRAPDGRGPSMHGGRWTGGRSTGASASASVAIDPEWSRPAAATGLGNGAHDRRPEQGYGHEGGDGALLRACRAFAETSPDSWQLSKLCPAELGRLSFIRGARDLGFSLDQVRALLSLCDDRARDCAGIDRIAIEHLHEVERKIADLTALGRELRAVIGSCDGGTIADCRIVEALGPTIPT